MSGEEADLVKAGQRAEACVRSASDRCQCVRCVDSRTTRCDCSRTALWVCGLPGRRGNCTVQRFHF